MGTFPGDTVVGILLLVYAGHTCRAEDIVVADLAPLLLVEESLSYTVHLVNIVTNLTVRSTELKIVEPIGSTLHKFLLSDAPA